MFLLPTVHTSFHSSLTRREIADRLSQLTAEPVIRQFHTGTDDPLFVGAVLGNEFELRRPIGLLSRRNAYSPLIKGRLQPTEDGTAIDLIFHPSNIAYGNLAMLVLFTVLVTSIIIADIISRRTANCLVLVPYMAMFLFYLVLRSIHVSALSSDKQLLKDILTKPMTKAQ